MANQLLKKNRTKRDKCSMCKCQLTGKYAPYCRECKLRYDRGYRLKKSSNIRILKSENFVKEVNLFVDKVLQNEMDVDLQDINSIVTYYTIVTKHPWEFDSLSTGKQIYEMFMYIKRWCNK